MARHHGSTPMRPFLPLRRLGAPGCLVLALVALVAPAVAQDGPGDLTRVVGRWDGVYYAFPHTNTGSILEVPGTTVELRQELTTISLGFAFEL